MKYDCDVAKLQQYDMNHRGLQFSTLQYCKRRDVLLVWMASEHGKDTSHLCN